MRFQTPRLSPFFFLLPAIGLALACSSAEVKAQQRRRGVKPALQSFNRQPGARINQRVLNQVTQDNSKILIVLSRQRAYLLLDGDVAVDTPISTGKRAGMTPLGRYKVSQKHIDHRSNLYGNFVDRQGRVVRAGVSSRIDSAPSGTRFEGAPMPYFLRFNGAVGMHVGQLPGYPASHGCVRLPANIAPIFYNKSKLGTSVEVIE